MNRNKWLRPMGTGLLVLTLLAPTLAACTKDSSNEDKTERTLRIATTMGGGPDDDWFRQQYTDIFEYTHPNVKLEIVPAIDYSKFRWNGEGQPPKMPDPVEALKELMNGPNAKELLMIDCRQLAPLITDNLLQPLDPLVTKDKFDTADIVPAVIDGIKKLSPDNKLYALAPTFSSSALVYNKKMFEEAGVTPPKDGMKWEEVFDLARRISKPKGDSYQYGFAFNNYRGSSGLWEASVYSAPMQLRMFNETGDKMTVDSDGWEKVWAKMLELRTQKVIPGNENPEDMRKRYESGRPMRPYEHELFLSGEVAMTIIDYGYINQLVQANRNAGDMKDFTPVDWDVVTVPVHPEYPGVGGYVHMNGVLGINAKAQNTNDAWRFIKFIAGEDWARTKSRSSHQLVSRQKYIAAKDGLNYNVKAFTKLAPINRMDESEMRLYREMPNIGMVTSIGDNKYREVMEGKKPIRQALKEWQTEGDAMLKQIKENPNGPMPHMQKGGAVAIPAG